VYGIVTPPAPALLSPDNGATGVSLTPVLNWTLAAGATSYDVYLGTSSPPPLAANTSAMSYSPSSLSDNATFYWNVVAKNGFGAAPSPIWSFSTLTCPPVVTPPAIFLDSTSQSAGVNVSAAPDCTWSASAAGGFINITSGASGTGSGAVTFAVAANSTGADLTGTLTVSAQAVAVTQRETATTFTDVSDPSAFFFNAANLMYARGITSGCSATPLMYCPGDDITRGQLAVFLVRAVLGGDNFTYSGTPYFTDVPPAYPFFKWIQKLKELQITNGCSAVLYCPDDPVTRGQAAAFVIRARYGPTAAFSYPATPVFADVPSSYLFFSYIQKMAQVGITNGCSATDYCPDESLTRGQMAVFVMRGLLNQLLPVGAAVLTAAAPDTASPAQILTVTLTGINTHFTQSASQVTTAPGITPSNVTVTSGTSLNVQLSVDPGTTPGPYSLVVTTGNEEAVLPNGFTVQ
jgi:hypothetical protein